jgi:hypothetical protein
MRNNQDRFGSVTQQNFSNPSATIAQPAFSFITPTELVELPSKGKFYPPDHPLHGKQTVEIKHMTAKEEDILTNKNYLEKGIVLDKLLESAFVDKSIDPASLLVIDKNAILLKVRITGYGSEYPSVVACNSCGGKTETTVDLENLLSIKDGEMLDGTALLENGLVVVELPVTKWKVAIKPLTGYDQAQMQKAFEMRKKHNLEENLLIETIKSFTVSINDVVDSSTVYSAIMSMPAKDSRFLRNAFQRCFPNITTEVNVTCGNCNSNVRTEVPFSMNFFWPE